MGDRSFAEASSKLRSTADVERRVREAVTPNESLLFLVWGVVYLVGYGSLYVNLKWGTGSFPVVGLIFLGVMALFGLVATFSEVRKKFRGLRGNTYQAVQRMVGVWVLLVVVWVLIEVVAFTGHANPRHPTLEIVAVAGATATLLVGIMYLLIVRDFPKWQIWLGVALVFIGIEGLIIDSEYSILFIAVGAGASFFLSALYSSRKRRYSVPENGGHHA